MTEVAPYVRRAADLERELARCRGRSVVVQAGGHIGIYPRLLAARFARVYTYEPCHENFACLTRNAPQSNVYAARAFLGERHGCATLLRHSKNTGGHHTGPPGGPIPVYRIDDLALDACDAIVLDVEGFELAAIRGAHETIHNFRPLVIAEENKQMRMHGREPGDVERFLGHMGYRVALRLGEDLVLEAA
jgi:FkbM family methyltransferase